MSSEKKQAEMIKEISGVFENQIVCPFSAIVFTSEVCLSVLQLWKRYAGNENKH